MSTQKEGGLKPKPFRKTKARKKIKRTTNLKAEGTTTLKRLARRAIGNTYLETFDRPNLVLL
jgi:hypothetical protein